MTRIAPPRRSSKLSSINSSMLNALWERGQRGWPARFPVVQLPNAPLSVALGGWLTAELTVGPAHAYARVVFVAGLSAWAWGEVTSGSNWFRRALGVAGFVIVVTSVGSGLQAGG